MGKCITFGEVMMRLNPEGYLRIIQADRMEVSFAGGELNVAVGLVNLGQEAEFVTKLPDNELGRAARMEMHRYGVCTEHVITGGERLGIYFVEKGASVRASRVLYDRKGSALSEAEPAEFDWNEIFESAEWFHFTGITPALGAKLQAICLEACMAAKEKGLTVSCDLNYRNKLWSREEANRCMSQLLPYVDVCISNEEDIEDVFGIKAKYTQLNRGRIDADAYREVAERLCGMFPVGKVAITLRGSKSASDNTWGAMLYDGRTKEAFYSDTYQIHIVDRVGGGDSFGAALIFALMSDYEPREAVTFAAAASCLKQTIEHDFNLVTVEEVQGLAQGNASGRVQR